VCRYAEHNYRTHYACLTCRHTAKYARGLAPRCPACGVEMIDLGRDFAAPRQNAVRQWRKLEILVAAGWRFESCGCRGPGLRPQTLGQAAIQSWDELGPPLAPRNIGDRLVFAADRRAGPQNRPTWARTACMVKQTGKPGQARLTFRSYIGQIIF